MSGKAVLQKIHLFLIPIDPKSSPPFWPLGRDDEYRLDRYRQEIDKKVMIQSRFALRNILAGSLFSSPLALEFYKEEAGKPKLLNPGRDLHFSLSHTHQWQAIAVSFDQEVGIDIENLLRQDVIGSLIEPQATNGKIQAWCAKEAIVKRWGIGWTVPPSYVKLSEDRNSAVLQGQMSQLFSMTLFDHHHVALAYDKKAKIYTHYLNHWSQLLDSQFSFTQIAKGY